MDGEWPPLTLHLLTQVYRLGQENFYSKAHRFRLGRKRPTASSCIFSCNEFRLLLLIQELDETLRAQVLEIMSRADLSNMLHGAVIKRARIVKIFGKKSLILALLYADA